MINLEIEDKSELQALHKALMEAKFHERPDQLITQSSPMVANVMNKVVDELEKINWVTDAEKKFKKIDWKNDWRTWRENPNEDFIVSSFSRHLDSLKKFELEDKEKFHELLQILVAPYIISEEDILSLYGKTVSKTNA